MPARPPAAPRASLVEAATHRLFPPDGGAETEGQTPSGLSECALFPLKGRAEIPAGFPHPPAFIRQNHLPSAVFPRSIAIRWASTPCRQVLFRLAKGMVLRRKTCPFARQNLRFHRAKPYLPICCKEYSDPPFLPPCAAALPAAAALQAVAARRKSYSPTVMPNVCTIVIMINSVSAGASPTVAGRGLRRVWEAMAAKGGIFGTL